MFDNKSILYLTAVETCLMVPDCLTMEEAAALPETFFTVWSNIFDRARLAEGESLLVHGGASGIGTTAIQMATALGHTVYTTAGSGEKCAACEKLGAAKAVNYKTDDFVDVIKAETGGKGVDVVLDMVGGDYIPRSIGCMAVEGRFVSIAFLQGSTAEVNFMLVMLKRLTITGSTLRARDLADKKVEKGPGKKRKQKDRETEKNDADDFEEEHPTSLHAFENLIGLK